MRADDDIRHAGAQLFDDLLLLARAHKAGQHPNRYRVVCHPVQEGVVMLLREDRGRDEEGHLLALLHRLECRADGDLGLAEAHVAADQAVHDLAGLHVILHSLDGAQLIIGLFKLELFFKLFLPDGIRAVAEALLGLARRIEPHQLGRDILDGRPHARLGVVPLLAAQPVDLRRRSLRAGIFLDLIKLRRQHIQ